LSYVAAPVANEDCITSPRRCQSLRIKIGDEVFSIDWYDISLGSYDMVLDVHWLESMGPILWDFGRCTIAFVWDGHRVLWSTLETGDPQSALLATSLDLWRSYYSSFSM
jgi:hypothetical protein